MDGPAPLYAALGCDSLPAVETPALVLVIVGPVLGSQIQAVFTSSNGLGLVAPVCPHGFFPAEGASSGP